MNEVWIRLGLITAALIGVLLTAGVIRSRARDSETQLSATGLEAGVFLFTSANCADCEPARTKLANRLGADGFTELRWEEQPGLFEKLKISVVPATLVVDDGGSGTLYPGQPELAMEELGP